MTTNSAHWATPLIGHPWSPERNCWWLVRTVFQQQLGITLPLLDVHNAPIAVMREASHASGWVPAQGAPQEWDVVLLQGPTGRHIGVMVWANQQLGLLHNMEDTGVIFQPLPAVLSMGYRNPEVWRRA